jgi:alpha-1,6-mannosyltransferase
MPIKTLHITNAWHQSSGGISTFYRALLNAAARAGRSLTLVVPAERDGAERVATCRICYVAAPHTPLFDRRYRLLLPHTYLPPLAGRLRRILQAEQPDVLEICDKYAVHWLAGLLRKGWLPGIQRPVLIGASHERMDDNVASFVTQREAGRSWAQRYLGYCYLPLFDYHLANSDYTADELHAAMLPRHERQVYVRPMGIDAEPLLAASRQAATRARLLHQTGGDERTALLLYVGRLSPEKNVELLVELMERLAQAGARPYRLLIAGAGPSTDNLAREVARRAPGYIYLLGHLGERSRLLELYANCDVFVHPNPREPFGIAPLEALAAGLPLVAPRAGGVLAYANDSNAWLAAPTAEAFAAAVQAVFADPAARQSKLARARATAARFRWSEVTATFFKLYDELHQQFPASRFARGALPATRFAASEKL